MSTLSRLGELIMGVSVPNPPEDDPHADAVWAETQADVLLLEARAAAAGGDLPRATSLVESVLARSSLREPDAADAWDLTLEIAVIEGDAARAEAAVDQLASRMPIGEARQRIRMVWVRHRADAVWENALLERAEAAFARKMSPSPEPEAPRPASSVRRLLDAIGADEEDDEFDDPGTPDAESAALFYGDPPLYTADELRSPIAGERVRALLEEDEADGEGLPLLAGTELALRGTDEIHRVIAEHPGASGRELLRRYAQEQARRTSPAELQHSYDMGVEFFGQEQFEEAAHLLLPVASVDNPERIGALELLARSLFELGRLPQAEAYLKEAVPLGRKLADPAYAPLFYWLGKISEEKGDPGGAVPYYASALQLAPDLVEAKRRLQTLLAL